MEIAVVPIKTTTVVMTRTRMTAVAVGISSMESSSSRMVGTIMAIIKEDHSVILNMGASRMAEVRLLKVQHMAAIRSSIVNGAEAESVKTEIGHRAGILRANKLIPDKVRGPWDIQ